MEHTMVNTMFIEVGSLSITRIRSFRFREFFFFLEVQLSACTFFDERVISSKSCLINEILI